MTMKNENELAGMIMDADIPKRLEAENAKLRLALQVARDYMNYSLGVGRDYEGPNPYPIIDEALGKPENIQWIVSGRCTFSGAICVVHAKDRAEALRKANAADNLDGIDTEGAEMVDWEFGIAEPDVEND